MKTRVRRLVQSSDSVVLLARFARELATLWGSVKRSRQAERQRLALLRAREERMTAYFAAEGPHKLQIGAGSNVLSGWLNTDFEPTSDDVVLLDALEPYPFQDRAFDYVFSEHMIEHIPYNGGLSMIREAFRVLKPRGRIRIATPDAARIAGLLAGRDDPRQVEYVRWQVVDHMGLYADQPSALQRRRPEWRIDPRHMRSRYPAAGRDGACFVVNNFFRSYGHQFLYDERTLRAALEDAGFVDITKAHPGVSDVPALSGLESHGRVIGDAANEFETIVLEGVRP